MLGAGARFWYMPKRVSLLSGNSVLLCSLLDVVDIQVLSNGSLLLGNFSNMLFM